MPSKTKLPDVDIDVADRALAVDGLQGVRASILVEGRLKKHPTGIYFQNVPVDPVENVCAFPSGKKANDLAASFGFSKMDFIPNYGYMLVRSPEHLRELLARPVPWEAFDREDIVTKLQHIGGYFTIVQGYQPQSIEDLACLIALIRPGKRRLIGKEMSVIKREVWKPEQNGYVFKKSHAIAFATMIVVQLQTLLEVEAADGHDQG